MLQKAFIGVTKSQAGLTSAHFLDLLRRLLGKDLGDPTMEVCTLLGIREIFERVHLECPILFDHSENGKRVVFDLIAVGSVAHDRDLFLSLHVMS